MKVIGNRTGTAIVVSAMICVLWRVLSIHPQLFSRTRFLMPSFEKTRVWQSIQMQADLSAGAPVAMYRVSNGREARFQLAATHTHMPTGLSQLWETAKINVGVHTASKSSPISDGERIYVGGDDSWFHAFRRDTGAELWRFYVARSDKGIHSTAAIDTSGVYFGSYQGTLYKLDRESGRLIWAHRVGDTIGSSPWLDANSLVVAVETSFPANGYLLKIDRATGEILWRSPLLGEQSHSSPSFDQASQLFVVGVNNSTLQAFSAVNGERKWSVASGGEIKSTPLLWRGIGYVSTWGKELLAFNPKSGEIIWRAPLDMKSQVSAVALEKHGWIAVADRDGSLRALDAHNGKLIWILKFKEEEGSAQMSSPVVLVGRNGQEQILFACRVSSLCLISPEGRVLSQTGVGGRISSVPWVDGDRVFVSVNKGSLISYELSY